MFEFIKYVTMHPFVDSSYNAMRQFIDGGHTLDVTFRKAKLKALYQEIENRSEEIYQAVYKDFHKSKEEMLITEVFPVLSEIKHTIANLAKWAKPQTVWSNVLILPSISKIHKGPKGVVVIFSPWNYSFYLAMMPLVSAIGAGNAVLLKPAHETAHVAAVIQSIVSKIFDPAHAMVVCGDGKSLAESWLSKYRFDHIFFTGSTAVGSWIAQKAAEKLSPVTLELGGKSPAIVDSTADLELAAKRIVWGKFLNAGQTCVCPDYVVVHRTVEKAFIELCKKQIHSLFGPDPLNSDKYTHLINESRFQKVLTYIHQGSLIVGGKSDPATLCIEPTLISITDLEQSIMQEEIFGPVLPLVCYDSFEDLLAIVRKNRNPLSLYVFTKDNGFKERILTRMEFGGGCSNNVIIHLGNPNLPFGGIQQSGNGNYHGKWGFETFSNLKPVVHFAKWFDISLHYHPYTESKVRLIRKFFGL